MSCLPTLQFGRINDLQAGDFCLLKGSGSILVAGDALGGAIRPLEPVRDDIHGDLCANAALPNPFEGLEHAISVCHIQS